jgi:hypothetical protein
MVRLKRLDLEVGAVVDREHLHADGHPGEQGREVVDADLNELT